MFTIMIKEEKDKKKNKNKSEMSFIPLKYFLFYFFQCFHFRRRPNKQLEIVCVFFLFMGALTNNNALKSKFETFPCK